MIATPTPPPVLDPTPRYVRFQLHARFLRKATLFPKYHNLMPELPDITVYCEALTRHYAGQALKRIDAKSPFVVRTFEPDISELQGKTVLGFSRMGKRIVWELEGGMRLVLHLMIAGRLHQRKPNTRPRGKTDLVAFHFVAPESAKDSKAEVTGTLMLTEQGSKRQASLHVFATAEEAEELNPGGLEIEQATLESFTQRLRNNNHTLKRALTDPHILSGIGNAYSDEILHAARLSPLKWTTRLTEQELVQLFEATQRILSDWTVRLRAECGDDFPEKVTAFHPQMATHGRYGQPCPECGTKVARIRYAARETNYCPECQTGGKLLADRSLSRLLKDDWGKE